MALRNRRLRSALVLAERERRRLGAELAELKPLLPLLRKRKRGEAWTQDERAAVRSHLRRLRALSPQLAILALPGGLALLPAYAWWVQRRERRHALAREP